MASSFERDIKIIFSFVKDQSKYDIPKITKELNELQNKLEDFGKFISSQFSLKISGIKDITELKNALISLNRTIVPVTDKFGNFANVIKNGLEGLNVLQIAQIESTLKELAAALSGISVAALNKQLNELAKVSKDVADKVVLTIKPLNDFENAIGKLDIKIQSSIANLLQYGQILEFISKSATSFAGLQGVKVPKIDVKSQENDVNKLLTEYTKLSGIIDRAGESVNKFNIANSRKLDEGSKKELISDIKRIKDSYDQLQAVIYQLNLRYQQLSSTENVDAVVLDKLSQEISEANALQNQRLQILNKSKQAEIELTNIEAKRKEVYNDQFNALGGVIKRQIQFITSAGILAGSVNFVRKGFKDTLDTLSEVQRVLTVSRSNFLSTADTIGLLRNTISDFSIKTGQSVRDVATVLKELGSAGLTTEQSIAALGPTLNNIIATDSNVVETTRLVASTYNILGDAVTGTSDQLSNFSRINDILARASLESSLELDQLVQALKFSLPAAKDAGLQLEDLVGILAQLADQGIKGGNAGRALRAALQQISKDTPRFAQTFNIPIDLNKPLQFLDIVRKFGDNIKGQEISAEELGDVFTRLGLRGADVFLLLGQSIDKVDNKIKDLRENSKGISEITADIRLESPERQIAILSENLSKLSGKIFEPIILGINLLIKKFNELATTVSLVGNNAFIKYSGYILGAVAVTKIFIELIGFVGGGLIKLSTAITTVQAASGAFAAIMAVIGGSLNAVLIIVGLLAVAVAGLAYLWTTKLAPSSAVVVKSLEDQNKALSKQVLENNKLISSYDGIAKQLLENRRNLDEGLITVTEYGNALNNLADSNEEVRNVLYEYGVDAEGAARALNNLSNEQKSLNKILLEEQRSNEKLIFEENKKSIEELIPKIQEAKKEFNNISNAIKAAGPEFLRNTDQGKKIAKSYEEVKKQVNDLNKEFRQLNVKNLTIANNATREFGNQIRYFTIEAKQAIGDFVTGLDSSISKLLSLTEISKVFLKDFDLSKLTFQIKELAGASDILSGGEAIQAKLLFDFNVDISDKTVKEINSEFTKINTLTAADIVGQSFVNNLNFSGLAQVFQEQINKSGVGFNVSLDELSVNLAEIAVKFNDITNPVERTKQQFSEINKVFGEILQKQIDFIKLEKEKALIKGNESEANALEEKRIKLEKERRDILEEINKISNNTNLSSNIQLETTKLQKQQEYLKNIELKFAKAALNESSRIRRSQLDQLEYDLNISRRKLKLIKEQFNIEKEQQKNTGIKNAEKIAEFTKKQADATRELAQNKEKIFQQELKITQQNELSELSLRKVTQTGSNIIDQSRIDLQINAKKLLFKIKELESNKNNATTGKRLVEIESELLSLSTERFQIQQKIREEQLVQQRTVEELQNRINELVFARTGQELTLLELSNKESELKNKILDIDKQIKETIDKEGFTSGTVNSLILKQKGLVIDILKNKKEQILASRKTYDNELKIFDLQGDLLSRSSKLTQDAISRVEDPLRKLIGLRIEAKPFDEIFKISRALNLSLTETNAIFGNTELATDLLFKGIKEGTVDFNRLDESIRKPALALREFNLQLQEQRRIQNEINKQKIEIFEKLLDQAIKFKDFKGATEALQNLANASEVVDIKTGNIDLSKTQKNLSDLQQHLEKIKKEDFEVNILSQLPDAIRESTKALKELADVLDRTKIDFTSDIVNASGTDKKIGSSFIDKIEITNNSLGNIDKSTSDFNTKFGDFTSKMESIITNVISSSETTTNKLDEIKNVNLEFNTKFDKFINQMETIVAVLIKDKKGFSFGGLVPGSGSGDIVPAMLEPGEFVIPKNIVEQKGVSYFENLIGGKPIEGFALGGLVRVYRNGGIVSKQDIVQFELQNIVESIFNNVEDSKNILNRIYGNDISYYPSFINGINNTNVFLEKIAESNNIIKDYSKLSYNQLVDIFNKIPDNLSKIFDKPVNTRLDTTKFATGGLVPGSGSGDIIPAMLEPGEFVIPKRIVKEKGVNYFENLIGGKSVDNNKIIKEYQEGGTVKAGDIALYIKRIDTNVEALYSQVFEVVGYRLNLLFDNQKEIIKLINDGRNINSEKFSGIVNNIREYSIQINENLKKVSNNIIKSNDSIKNSIDNSEKNILSSTGGISYGINDNNKKLSNMLEVLSNVQSGITNFNFGNKQDDNKKLFEELNFKIDEFFVNSNSLSNSIRGKLDSLSVFIQESFRNKTPKFSLGGLIPGSGSGDIVPAMLEPGEFVIPKNIVEQKGIKFFDDLIGGKPEEGFKFGGLVRAYRNGGIVKGYQNGGLVNNKESQDNSNINNIIEILSKIEFLNDRQILRLDSINENINNIGINNNKVLLDINDNTDNAFQILKGIIAPALNKSYAKSLENISSSQELTSNGMAFGGLVPGSGSGDIVPAMLEPGEFVIPKKIVEQKGIRYFENLIGKNSEGFKYGGLVGHYKDGGSVENIDRILNVFFDKLNKGFEKFFNNFDKKLVETNNNINKEISNIQIKKDNVIKDNNIVEFKESIDTNKFKKEIEDIFLNIEIPTLGKLSEFKNLGIGLGGLKELNKLGELKDLFGNINENSDGLKPIIDNFKNVNSIIDNINKEIIELQSSILNPFKSLEDQLQRIASTSANVFDRISAKALLKLIPTIDKIEDKFRELFTQDLPSFIGFFLDKVVLSNIKILAQYEKQRKKLQENYKNQKADLIEALKRNEISYFDFFDKLEDLQDNRKKEEEDNRKEELDALTDSIRDAFGEIANKLKDIVKDMSETFSNFVLGIPAGLDLIAGNFGTLFGGINKAFVNLFSNFGIEVKGFAGGIGATIGGAIGGISSLLGGPGGLLAGAGIGGAIGDTVGGVVESVFSAISGPVKIFGQALLTSVTGFFNFALQGFSELLPLVIQLGLMTNDEFEAFVNSVSTLPDKIKEVTTGLADRIPKIVDILTSVDNANAEPLLVTIAKSFADGMEKVFQQIIPAFGKIVGVAVVAVQPILVKFLKLIPEFISQLGPLVLELIPAFITLIAQIVTAFVQSIRNDLPRIAANILSTINTILDAFISQLLSPRFIDPITNAIAGAATEAAPVIANTLGRSGEIIVNSVSQAAPGIVTAFENQFPKIGDKLLQSISTNINSGALDVGPKITMVLSDGISKFIKEFLASIPKIVTFLGSLLLSTIKNVLNEISNIRNVFSNIGNVIKEEFTKNIKDELAKLPENITEAFKAIKQTIQDILSDPTIVLTITLGIAGAFIAAMGLASEKGIENFIDTFIAKIPEVITAFFDIFSPDNISKISISIIDGIDKALQSGLGNLDIEGGGFTGILGELVEIGKQFLKILPLMLLFNAAVSSLEGILTIPFAALGPIGSLLAFIGTIIAELNPVIKIWLIILNEVLKVLFKFGKFLSQEFISALISIQDQFDDLLQAANEVIIQFSILTSDIFAGVSVAILSITNVFKKLTEDSIFTTKSIDAARKAASTFGDILKNVLGKTIDSLIRSSNKVSDLLIKLQNSILGTGVVVDSTTKIFDEISSIIDETNKVLEPLVDFLMPGLEALLTALALILVGPLLIGLTAIIIELELIIIVIDLLNSSFETLAPIIEELSPIFEQLSPVFEKIFIAIKPFISVLLALTIIFILLTSPIGPLIAILVILSVTVIAISKSIELFNKVSSDLIPVINDLIKYFNEVILPIVIVVGKIILLAAVIGLLLSPIGPLIIGIGLLVGAFIIFLKILPSIIKLLNSIISPIVRIFKSLIRIVGLLLSLFVRKISDVFKDIVNRINVFLDPIINTIIEGFIFIRDSINIIVNEITQFIINGFIFIRDLINEILNPIVNFVTENFNIIRNIIFEVITNIRDFIILEFTNIYNQIVIALTPLTTAIDIFITPIIDGIIEFMNNIYNIIITGLNDIIIGIIEFSQPFIDIVIGLFNTLMTAISFAIRLAIDLINNEILIPLQTRVNEIVTSISQTIDELFESNPELQEIKEEFIKIKESLSEIVDSFITFREDIKTEFNGLINDLIKIVQDANPANVVNSSSGGSSSGGGFSPPGIPGFAFGGLIKGMKGKDKIPAMVSDGEFIIKKDIVDKYGSKFFDIINKGGKAQQALKNYGDTSTNANTREYYLSNFFADDAGSGRGSSVTANQVDGPDSGTTISRSNSVAFRGDTVAGTAAPQTVETNNTEKKIDINFNLDFKGANFTSEDAADNVKNSIVEELDNNQGELARKIREMLKG